MEKHIAIQEDLIEKVKKAQINFKKSPRDRLSKGYVESRLEALERYYTDFSKRHEILISGVSKETRESITYFTDSLDDKFEEQYHIYKGELINYLQTFHAPSTSQSVARSSSDIKLPRINIPQFSGDYTEWQSFYDMFLVLIHNNTTLESVQKLHYLKSSLSGEAEALLRQISITGDNYNEAWSILKGRYNNKRYIANNIFKKLFNQKTLITESAQALKQILDTTVECINSLKNLGLPTQHWDVILVYIVVSKLDAGSLKLWEESLSTISLTEFATFDHLKTFFETRFRTLEMIESSIKVNKIYKPKAFHTTVSMTCPLCKEKHLLYTCKSFSKSSPRERYEFVQKNNLCFNCLASNHTVHYCRQKTSCRMCGRRHHSLLHQDRNQNDTTHSAECRKEVLSAFVQHGQHQPGQHVLLSTALVNISRNDEFNQVYRALIDSGSQASFVSQHLVQSLRLKKIPINGVVKGLGEASQQLYTHYMVVFTMKSRYESNFAIQVKAYVLNSLTGILPCNQINISNWPEINNLSLADPHYGVPNKIDILLGAEVHARILKKGLIRHESGGTIAQNTHLGWVISGEIENNSNCESTSERKLCFHAQFNLNEELKKFWEIESEGSRRIELTKEERLCEEIYATTTQRDEEGRYIVYLPFKEDVMDPIMTCGNTKDIAVSRLKQLEKRFNRDEELKMKYKEVIDEYLKLGFMKEITERCDMNEIKTKDDGIYLPHHPVLREDKDTTKCRVVYNASSKGSNGLSLNDMLMVGPTLQRDLYTLILKWRSYKICLVADIVKMYLMIKIATHHSKYQRLVWRDPYDPERKIKEYELLTVTFGTASAPYLAVRSLFQLADDEKGKYPKAAEIVKSSFYMDDLMTGGDNIEDAKEIYHQINQLIPLGGFKLQKWSSNSDELISYIKQEVSTDDLEIKVDKIIKILGLVWNRDKDNFVFSVNLQPIQEPITKRIILSDIAKLFDPFGWLAPTVIIAKVFIQKLWLLNLSWDDPLPNEVVKEWNTYRSDLHNLHGVTIVRWLSTTGDADVELHGFADASMFAYAAVVYSKVKRDGKVYISIITSKTKVAPVKQISIPRLELCAAVLLAHLLRDIASILRIPNHKVFAWTDSKIVLAWLQGHPIKWKVFVANRVTEILNLLDNDRWNHVASGDNPADLASRGVKPSELADKKLWWQGPEWLKDKELIVHKVFIESTDLESRNKDQGEVTTLKTEVEEPIYTRFSSLTRLIRVVAYMRKFLRVIQSSNKPQNQPYLSVRELKESLDVCIKICQQTAFQSELEDLKGRSGKQSRGRFCSLSPILDEAGLVRVGGRLQGALVSTEMKYPILLPNKNHFSRLLIKDAHYKTLHGGQLLMMNYLRSRYWILGLRTMVKQCIHSCITCIRHKASTRVQFMGQLPTARITPGRPFVRSGVDFAGPIQIRTTKGRGHHATKGYICLFVCMVTKAIHLEAVSDLTAQGFLAAFKRFVSRRGHCCELWSDNATNFVGASRELKIMHESSKKNITEEIAGLLANDGTSWHHIPPEAPHHGGLWEAGVKSTKSHLKRIIGDTTLTFEEMSTLLAQIEACLNSRPIAQTTDSPDDLLPLTPAHFLVGEPLITIPDRNYDIQRLHPLSRWQLVQRMTQHFWNRWSKEYLHNLQQRYKWNSHQSDLKVEDVVIIKENNLPPTKWLLGKVIQTYPGPDGHVRVVSLRCRGGSIVKRPISKLIYLPIKSL